MISVSDTVAESDLTLNKALSHSFLADSLEAMTNRDYHNSWVLAVAIYSRFMSRVLIICFSSGGLSIAIRNPFTVRTALWLSKGKPYFKEYTGMHSYYHYQWDPCLIPFSFFFLNQLKMLKLILLFFKK